MEDYTRYRLKKAQELAEVLEGKDKLFVIACNKCFKEFITPDEQDCDEFAAMAKKLGKTVTGAVRADFLCNKVQTQRLLDGLIPEGTEYVAVVACGLGAQTIADEVSLPIIAAADSVGAEGHHGMALTKKACGACAQCYLSITGGICPVVDCSKSLINGQCGGAKNGKCEVDPEKDCAWEKIYRRLELQKRTGEFEKQPVQLRDYSRTNFKVIKEYVDSVREKRFAGYYGGVHPLERKELSEHIGLVRFPQPDEVVIPLSMHTGAPAQSLVKTGDRVKLGQKIGEQAGFISAPVHSSVSGTVLAVEERLHPSRGMVTSIVIKNDKLDTPDDGIRQERQWEELTADEITDIVKEKGIVGMGGAGFPAYVKLKPGKPIDAVLLNGCECEPLITADHRVLLEYADDVVQGLRIMMKAVSAPKGIIIIEDNKPDAVELLTQKTADIPEISVLCAKTKYPQGAEKMLIKLAMGRKVPSGGLPADVGAIVSNVSSAKAVADAVCRGIPLTERVVSVTGERIKRPGNYIVKIGTSVKDLIDYCGGICGADGSVRNGNIPDDVCLKMGGPMMGSLITDINVPIIKTSNGVIAIDTDTTREVSCIKCGRCADVCPMELKPLYFARYADEENWTAMKQMNVMDCIECRSCEYICSSKIPLSIKIKAGKAAVRGMK